MCSILLVLMFVRAGRGGGIKRWLTSARLILYGSGAPPHRHCWGEILCKICSQHWPKLVSVDDFYRIFLSTLHLAHFCTMGSCTVHHLPCLHTAILVAIHNHCCGARATVSRRANLASAPYSWNPLKVLESELWQLLPPEQAAWPAEPPGDHCLHYYRSWRRVSWRTWKQD